MDVDIAKIRALADLANEKKLAEIEVSDGKHSVTIKTMPEGGLSQAPQVVYAPLPASVSSSTSLHTGTVVREGVMESPGPGESLSPAKTGTGEMPNGYVVTAPMVGTFYRAPSPEADPFTDLGQVVTKGQTLCIIEAMKMMNELESEVSGKVMKVLVENAQPVEFGQPLMVIDTQLSA